MFKFLRWGLLALGLVACSPFSPTATSSDGAASVSSPLALSPDGRTLWVVNPDANSLTPVDTASLTAGTPIAVGDEPWGVAVTPSGIVVVMNRAGGSLSLIQGGIRSDIEVGPEPGGLALSPSGKLAYVTISSADEIAVVDLSLKTVTQRIRIGPIPWAIAVSDDGDADDGDETVVVTHRLARLRAGGSEAMDDGKEGFVSLVRGSDVREVAIAPYDFGYANVLEGLAIQGGQILVSHLLNAPALPRDFDHTISAAISTLSLTSEQELGDHRLHLNEDTFSTPVSFPRALALSPDGNKAYVVLSGTDAVMGIDRSDVSKPRLIGFWGVGKNPRGMVLSKDGKRAFVMNYLSRDVSVLDLSDEIARKEEARVKLGAEPLDAQLLKGKILFNNANNPRLSRLGWISCASCHPDGGVDGTTWLTPDGPRQTQPLWKLEGTAPFHASATRDEVQDFEHDIEGLMNGVGLASGVALRELGEPSSNRSADLDALAVFVLKGTGVPKANKADIATIERGRQVFIKADCQACHGGLHWTNSQLPSPPGTLSPNGEVEVKAALRDVGTVNTQDVLGQGGFDVPTLLGLHATAPYLHDGSAKSLESALDNSQHLNIPLSPQERADLVMFLKSIDGQTQAVFP